MKTSSQYRADAREALRGNWGWAALVTLVLFLIVALFVGPYEAHSVAQHNAADSLFVAMGHRTMSLLFYLLGMLFVIIPLQMGFANVFLRVFRGNQQQNYIADMFSTGYKNMGNAIVYQLLLMCISFGIALVWAIIFGVVVVLSMADSIATIAALDLSSADALFEMFSGAAGTLVFIIVLYIALLVVLVWLQYVYKFTWYIMLDNPNMSAADCMRESRKLTKGKRWKLFVLDLSFIGWYLLGILGACIPLLWIVPYNNTAVAAFYHDQLPKQEDYIEVEAEIETTL